ncbi:MAG: putative Fe-S protein YdhL (DUF1289 family) [Halieaceae bacterium]|jgi:predicted Fe-S protein YdhL (DUF1289 family)
MSAGEVQQSAAGDPASPCISVCALREDGLCLGCYRSAEEITDWFMASAGEKRVILARARQRREEGSSTQFL